MRYRLSGLDRVAQAGIRHLHKLVCYPHLDTDAKPHSRIVGRTFSKGVLSMPFPVSELIKDRGNPVSVLPDESVLAARELMVVHDFSQLPIVDDDGVPLGMITSDSILAAAGALGVSADILRVSDAKAPRYATHGIEDDLFRMLDDLQAIYAVLIVDDMRKLVGIVTSYDAAEYFRRRAQDMMVIEDIENYMRDCIRAAFLDDHGKWSTVVTKFMEDKRQNLWLKSQSALHDYLVATGVEPSTIRPDLMEEVLTKHIGVERTARSFDGLTFDEYKELFLHQSKWPQLEPIFGIKRPALLTLLNNVRDTRNQLAHFRGEISARQSQNLQYCRDLLQDRQSAVLSAFLLVPTTPTPVKNATEQGATKTVEEPDDGKSEAGSPRETLGPDDSRYARLALRLMKVPRGQDLLELGFQDVETIIDGPLPPYSREHRSWWSDDTSSLAHAREWLDAGWYVSAVDMTRQIVVFARNKEREQAIDQFIIELLELLRPSAPFTVMPRPTLVPGRTAVFIAGLPERGLRVARLAAGFARNGQFAVDLSISTGDLEKNKRIYNALAMAKGEIETEVGEVLSWERRESPPVFLVGMYRDSAITDNEEKLADLRRWAVDALIRMHKAMDSRIAEAIKAV